MSADTSHSAGADPATWLDAHGDYLFAYARSRVRSRQIAEDLVQETLLAAIQGRASFQAQSSVRTWLVGILKHKLIDHLRKAGGDAVRHADSHSQAHGEAGEEALRAWTDRQFSKGGKWVTPPKSWSAHRIDEQSLSPSELQELRSVLDECLNRLPPRACEALVMTERSSMPAEKVGKVLDASTTNIGVLLHRARTALRHCLEVHWFGRKGA
jgi:RNA polymerase sigma-70 factor (TIGR02943 family)